MCQNITETHNKLSIWVLTSYTGPTMLSVCSQLLLSSNSTFPILWQNHPKCQIFSVNQKSDLSLKLNATRQQESRDMFGFQNSTLDIKLLQFQQIKTIGLTSKNAIFNRNSLAKLRWPLDSWCRYKSKTGLRSWFRVLIGLTHKTRQLKLVFLIVSFEKCDFYWK